MVPLSKHAKNVSKMDKACRCCLDPNPSNGIFDRCDNFKISYAEMLSICSRIPVSENDGLPPFICDACVVKLRITYSFRKLSLDSLSKLISPVNAEDVSGNIPNIVMDEVMVCDTLTPRSSHKKHKKDKKQKKHRGGKKSHSNKKPTVKDVVGSIELFLVKSSNTKKDKRRNGEQSRMNKINLRTLTTQMKKFLEKKPKPESPDSEKGKEEREIDGNMILTRNGSEMKFTDVKSSLEQSITLLLLEQRKFNAIRQNAINQNAEDSITPDVEETSANSTQEPSAIPENGLLDQFQSLQLETEKTEQARGTEE